MLPVFFRLNGFIVYAYPIFIGMALACAYLVIEFYYKKFKLNLIKFNIIFFGATFFAWIGAKILFLLSAPKEQLKILFNTNFWLGGGFVFYGGLIGIIFFLFLFNLIMAKNKISFRELALLIPGLTIAHAIGRIGCFFAGCCYGIVCDLPWSVKMHSFNRHPVQLYESFSLFILTFMIIKKINQNKFKQVFIIYAGGYSIIRFLLEYFRGDKIRGIYHIFDFSISTSQIIALIFFIVSLIIWKTQKEQLDQNQK